MVVPHYPRNYFFNSHGEASSFYEWSTATVLNAHGACHRPVPLASLPNPTTIIYMYMGSHTTERHITAHRTPEPQWAAVWAGPRAARPGQKHYGKKCSRKRKEEPLRPESQVARLCRGRRSSRPADSAISRFVCGFHMERPKCTARDLRFVR